MTDDRPDPAPSASRRLLDEAVAAVIPLWSSRHPEFPALDHVAERLGVDLGTLRGCVPSMDMLVTTVVNERLATLNDACMKAVVPIDPAQPVEQVMAVGRAFVDWVLVDPRVFRLLVSCPASVPVARDNVERQIRAMRDLVARLLRRGQDIGRLDACGDVDLATGRIVAAAYGLAHLLGEDRLALAFGEHADATTVHAAMEGVIRDMTAGLGRADLAPQPSRSDA